MGRSQKKGEVKTVTSLLMDRERLCAAFDKMDETVTSMGEIQEYKKTEILHELSIIRTLTLKVSVPGLSEEQMKELYSLLMYKLPHNLTFDSLTGLFYTTRDAYLPEIAQKIRQLATDSKLTELQESIISPKQSFNTYREFTLPHDTSYPARIMEQLHNIQSSLKALDGVPLSEHQQQFISQISLSSVPGLLAFYDEFARKDCSPFQKEALEDAVKQLALMHEQLRLMESAAHDDQLNALSKNRKRLETHLRVHSSIINKPASPEPIPSFDPEFDRREYIRKKYGGVIPSKKKPSPSKKQSPSPSAGPSNALDYHITRRAYVQKAFEDSWAARKACAAAHEEDSRFHPMNPKFHKADSPERIACLNADEAFRLKLAQYRNIENGRRM